MEAHFIHFIPSQITIVSILHREQVSEGLCTAEFSRLLAALLPALLPGSFARLAPAEPQRLCLLPLAREASAGCGFPVSVDECSAVDK